MRLLNTSSAPSRLRRRAQRPTVSSQNSPKASTSSSKLRAASRTTDSSPSSCRASACTTSSWRLNNRASRRARSRASATASRSVVSIEAGGSGSDASPTARAYLSALARASAARPSTAAAARAQHRAQTGSLSSAAPRLCSLKHLWIASAAVSGAPPPPVSAKGSLPPSASSTTTNWSSTTSGSDVGGRGGGSGSFDRGALQFEQVWPAAAISFEVCVTAAAAEARAQIRLWFERRGGDFYAKQRFAPMPESFNPNQGWPNQCPSRELYAAEPVLAGLLVCYRPLAAS